MPGSNERAGDDRDWGSLAVALGVAVIGAGILGGLAYVEVTTTVTRADYATFQAGCADLANQSRLTDAGLGQERVALNETHVRRCENTTFAEYRRGRLDAMDGPPLNARQWLLYGGGGLVFLVGGSGLLRQELSRS
jgi:hypothetical protein